MPARLPARAGKEKGAPCRSLRQPVSVRAVNLVALIFLSVSMSADAFAASVAKGAADRPDWRGAIRGGLVFGIIEAITPLLGWALGSLAADFVASIDHWVAFILLGVVGGRLIRESLSDRPEPPQTPAQPRGPFGLALTAVATSIDAAAVGISLAFLDVNIWIVAAMIGVSTFLFTTAGLMLGGGAGRRLGARAELAGGIVLIGIGTLILLDHLGWLARFGLTGI
jgi:putative Mn2+ efflux pump MntP